MTTDEKKQGIIKRKVGNILERAEEIKNGHLDPTLLKQLEQGKQTIKQTIQYNQTLSLLLLYVQFNI